METYLIIMARSRAVHFFGTEEYERMLTTAKEYLDRERIPIPPKGVESMPIFWECINNLITDVVA